MAELSSSKRKGLSSSSFVYPKQRAFPIHDIAHATAALRLCGRATKRFGPNVCKVVKRKVCAKYGNKIGACKRK